MGPSTKAKARGWDSHPREQVTGLVSCSQPRVQVAEQRGDPLACPLQAQGGADSTSPAGSRPSPTPNVPTHTQEAALLSQMADGHAPARPGIPGQMVWEEPVRPGHTTMSLSGTQTMES